jgi:hypothetical protein
MAGEILLDLYGIVAYESNSCYTGASGEMSVCARFAVLWFLQ